MGDETEQPRHRCSDGAEHLEARRSARCEFVTEKNILLDCFVQVVCVSRSCSSTGLEHNSAEYIHLVMEALRISFAAGGHLIADPESADDAIRHMLDDDRARAWSKQINLDRCADANFGFI